MKKRFIINLSIILLSFMFAQSSFAQSDYKIVQNFKAKHREIEKQIIDATSLEALNAVVTGIDQLKQEYVEHRELLDKGLYPDNYNKAFEKLNVAYVLRQGDFTTIDVLQTEVVELEQEVEFLNRRNNELIINIADLKARRNKDGKTIAELENLIADLRISLRKRDKLVVDMMDKLMPPIMREKAKLSPEDKNLVRREERKEDVLENVKISIEDNIRFLEATSLNPDDIKDVQKQQEQFSDTWKATGPKLVDVYADKSSKAMVLKEIDSLYSQWYSKSVDQNVWRSIRDEFKANGINLKEFNYGDEFVITIKLFIKDEIKNLGVKSDDASEKAYVNFTDSTWFASVKPKWVPYLMDGGLLTVEQKDEVEISIEEWKSELYPSKLWIYILIWCGIVIILVPAVLILIKRRKKSKEKFKDIANE
ncbi:MAG: hypothetical protein DRQ01_01290 [Ignavibacteriae bacterium]|nr:MAG: hypothetical protein DRQ01_01290 [Ignavibacteriota bacterium]